MDVQFSTYCTKIQGHEVEIYEDGLVSIEIGCCCGHDVELDLMVDDLMKLGSQAKLFMDRRVLYKTQRKPRT